MTLHEQRRMEAALALLNRGKNDMDNAERLQWKREAEAFVAEKQPDEIGASA